MRTIWEAVVTAEKPHLWDDGVDVVFYRVGRVETGDRSYFIREAEDHIGNPDPNLPLVTENGGSNAL